MAIVYQNPLGKRIVWHRDVVKKSSVTYRPYYKISLVKKYLRYPRHNTISLRVLPVICNDAGTRTYRRILGASAHQSEDRRIMFYSTI